MWNQAFSFSKRGNSGKLWFSHPLPGAMLHNKNQIVPDKPVALRRRSATIRPWLAALIGIPLFSVVAAFGIAPNTQVEQIPVHKVINALAPPSALVIDQGNEEFWREDRFLRGDTVASLLARLHVHDSAAMRFLRAAAETRSLYQLKSGKSVQAKTTATGDLLALRYVDEGNDLVVVEKSDASFTVKRLPLEFESRLLVQSGEINSSLFAATDAADLPDSIATQLADVFSGDIDFHKDLRKGDRFTVVYEVLFHHGEPVRTGRVHAAEFVTGDGTYQAVYFEAEEGRGGYYTADGKSTRKSFLRAPLEVSRVSSGFNKARFHPALQSWRAHKGIDYAAPTGTKVKATADGRVAVAGRQGGYGNVVILEHAGKYSTVYGHLSRFAKGLSVGDRVAQGQVIGYVGSTGLATGPHLHYEFLFNGEQLNPLRMVIPDAPPITAETQAAFSRIAKPLLQRLTLLREETNLASVE